MKGGREWEEKEDGWMRRRKGKDGEKRVEREEGRGISRNLGSSSECFH